MQSNSIIKIKSDFLAIRLFKELNIPFYRQNKFCANSSLIGLDYAERHDLKLSKSSLKILIEKETGASFSLHCFTILINIQ